MVDPRRFGRFGRIARLVLEALGDGPRPVSLLLDDVRAADGPIGAGSLYAAIARLERSGLIERAGRGGAATYQVTHREIPG